MILARAEIDYRIPARYGDALEIRIGLERIGRTSFTYAYEVVDQEGRTVADARSVQVMYDYAVGPARAALGRAESQAGAARERVVTISQLLPAARSDPSSAAEADGDFALFDDHRHPAMAARIAEHPFHVGAVVLTSMYSTSMSRRA